jgi:hypothetical protein
MKNIIPNGLSLREALQIASELHVPVKKLPGTGEYIVRTSRKFVRQNARSKVANREFVNALRDANRKNEDN